jgi:cell fate regulator YaaT (PSP1 superfamily)
MDTAVIVETARGVELGWIAQCRKQVSKEEAVLPLKKIVRIATEEDLQRGQDNRTRVREALDLCNAKIAAHRLDMKLTNVEIAFDGSKILFYFTADGRVDFRDLVKDLAGAFHTRIELRQIGVRDESKMLGGLGICGREFCCSSYLTDFHPVSIRMAKEQGLSLNPTKISGTCGRLMCCLKYEQHVYEDAIRRLPKTGAIVETPRGQGTVVDVNLLKETVKIRLDSGNDVELQVFKLDEIQMVRNGRSSASREEPEVSQDELKALED